MILGIDEVGRGAWAGPLVVGAVVLGGVTIDGLTDSKKLAKNRRSELNDIIRSQAIAYGLGWVHADEIDRIGLSESLKLATKLAVEQIKSPYHEIIIDGTVNFLAGTKKGNYVTLMPKADLLIPSVSAASIIAKVARDEYMSQQDTIYHGYKFKAHVGYGTDVHRRAIEMNGVIPLHRLSFAPLSKYRPAIQVANDKDKISTALVIDNKTSINQGKLAEEEVADYLIQRGHKILERNWKTKYCEIDIVSLKNESIFFTEVKYRRQQNQGGGMAAITNKKINKMQFAARIYIQAKHLKDNDMLLAAASVTGERPVVEEWLILN